MRFKANEIVSVLEQEIEQYRSAIDTREVGRVLEVGDGIARVYGLSNVMAGEMVEFKRTGVRGLAFNLEETRSASSSSATTSKSPRATRWRPPGSCCACRWATP
jgi:F0F1-type ATP synthase alpha subunit